METNFIIDVALHQNWNHFVPYNTVLGSFFFSDYHVI